MAPQLANTCSVTGTPIPAIYKLKPVIYQLWLYKQRYWGYFSIIRIKHQ